ncbi:fibronectin type III-like domain-contianing protein, partial [Caulobacter sp.]|uniref:fibronectin type III-like domain-contianing protein n=1 Tax=Caulobacter sp. TaxID=78 RepID=UPI001B2E0790
GWTRVTLQPGESRQVTITADPRLLASYDVKGGAWRRAGGAYDVYVGKAAGSRDLVAKVSLKAGGR